MEMRIYGGELCSECAENANSTKEITKMELMYAGMYSAKIMDRLQCMTILVMILKRKNESEE